MIGGGSSSSRSSSESTPWRYQSPFLYEVFQEGQANYQTPLEYFPGSTVAARDPYTQAGIDLAGQRALGGSPNVEAAQRANLAEVRGDYLGSNPHLDAMYGRASERVSDAFQRTVLPEVTSRFALAGRSGSGAEQTARSTAYDALAQQLGDLSAQIYGGNYEAERDRQQRAQAAALPLANQDYYDALQAQQAGTSSEDYAQRVLEDAIARHDYEQMEPWQRLQLYQGAIQMDPIMVNRGTSSGSSRQASLGLK